MFILLLLAHLVGDYVLQFDWLARWKARTTLGVLVHGAVVLLLTLACVAMVLPAWWPYALAIGLSHTGIDFVRARVLKPRSPLAELLSFIVDQLLHLVIIAALVVATGAPRLGTLTWINGRIVEPVGLATLTGVVSLLHPARVVLRFVVRGMWGLQAAPPLEAREKLRPMVDRVLIATLVLSGYIYLIPLVVLPGRIQPHRVQGNGVVVFVHVDTHWAELLLSVTLAVIIGASLRATLTGSW
ncbi:MAG: DUF3307 domain-containing protein [Anaerolineae bacterium]|nr:DUF3307 domain-containing protein [Anaerolineae bacterium]